jgi:hypothetical protein
MPFVAEVGAELPATLNQVSVAVAELEVLPPWPICMWAVPPMANVTVLLL